MASAGFLNVDLGTIYILDKIIAVCNIEWLAASGSLLTRCQ